ncbi:MAG: hypothetical protein HYY01_11655 [Chloroflexi bacterium]|nr:hypothetical protein [Chloroflexota bacterium]
MIASGRLPQDGDIEWLSSYLNMAVAETDPAVKFEIDPREWVWKDILHVHFFRGDRHKDAHISRQDIRAAKGDKPQVLRTKVNTALAEVKHEDPMPLS